MPDAQNVNPVGVKKPRNHNRLILGGVFVVVVIAAAILWWFLFESSSTPAADYSAEKTPFSVLVTDNLAFVEAEELLKANDLQGARGKYLEALQVAKDTVQEAQIRFKIASVDMRLGFYIGAIREFKQIAGDTKYYNLVRAYAAENIATMYYMYGYGTTAKTLIDETFTGDFYGPMYAEKDVLLAYRRVYEYASSLYPLGLSEMRIADWYARESRALVETPGTSDQIRENFALVLKKIETTDADIARTQNDPNAAPLIPGILGRKAEVIAKMSRVAELTGEKNMQAAKEKGISYEDAENAYRQALQLRAVQGNAHGEDGFERFLYASFLERFFDSRNADIPAVLAPFYENPGYGNSAAFAFLAAQKDSTEWMHASLVNMAAIDPKFKELLVSLGWTGANFARAR